MLIIKYSDKGFEKELNITKKNIINANEKV